MSSGRNVAVDDGGVPGGGGYVKLVGWIELSTKWWW